MRIEFFLLCLIACLPSNSTPVITLPNRTSVGRASDYYDPCIKSYTQRTPNSVIEERICVSSIGNTSVEEYFDTARNYPCSWLQTSDDKVRCIPASIFDKYYSSLGDKPPPISNTYLTLCAQPIVSLEVDPYEHPKSHYVGLLENRKFHVYEVGRIHEHGFIYITYHSEMWDEDYCDITLPMDHDYPTHPKNYRWFYLGGEVDPTIFQER
jgi:hypothetical protein